MLDLRKMRRRGNAGFTILELLLAFALFAISATLITINFVRPQTAASISTTTDTLAADIKNQQIKAMDGDSMGAASAQSHGIVFQPPSAYVLFRGSSYSPGDSENLTVDTSPAVISTTLPSSTIIFQRISGEPTTFTSGQNTVTISNAGESKTITINRYGVMAIN